MSNNLQRLFMVAVLAWGTTGPMAQDQVGKVKANRLNVRGQPRLQSEVVTQLKAGDRVTILEEIPIKSPPPGEPSKWAKIAMPNNTPVWVHGIFVENGVVTARRLNIRSGPGEQYSVVGRLVEDQTVKINRKVENWLEIEPPPGTYAFVDGSMIEATGPAPVEAKASTQKPANPKPKQAPVVEKPSAPAKAADPVILPEPKKSVEPVKPPDQAPLPEPVKTPDTSIQKGPLVAETPAAPVSTPVVTPVAAPVATPPTTAAAASTRTPGQPFSIDNARTLDERIIAMQMAGRTPPPSYPAVAPVESSTPAVAQPLPLPADPGGNAIPVVSTPYIPEAPQDGSFPSLSDPSEEIAPPPIKRVVRREGVVSKTFSIQAPTYSELEDPLTGRAINYLYGVNAGIDVKPFRGKRVIATGREGVDPRWPNVPVLFLETLETAP